MIACACNVLHADVARVDAFGDEDEEPENSVVEGDGASEDDGGPLWGAPRHFTAYCVSRDSQLHGFDQARRIGDPRPAMSNAVPWSTDVRMIGSPSVTFTARPNAAIFTGIRP